MVNSAKVPSKMTIETTVFDFKITQPFDQWAAIFDSDENKSILKSKGISPLYRGRNQEDSSRAIVIFQAEKGVAKKMWVSPETQKETNPSKHIYNEPKITCWDWGTSYPS